MKSNHVKARPRAAQQNLFAEAMSPPLPAVAIEEIRSALAELLLDAMRAGEKERASESQDH